MSTPATDTSVRHSIVVEAQAIVNQALGAAAADRRPGA